MTTPYVGEIMLFGGGFAPRGWALCDGQLLSVTQNDALFSLLGTTYGGDGRTTFALPDLRGRVPVHLGPSVGLGTRVGSEHVTLTDPDQLGPHTHSYAAEAAPATDPSPKTNLLGETSQNDAIYVAGTPDATLDTSSIGLSGGGQGHDNMMPFQAINYCIALAGIYPSRT